MHSSEHKAFPATAPIRKASGEPPAIELRRVSLYFDEHPALLDVSLSVGMGEMLMLLGPTGSGKSVLLKTVLGLLKPASGQILVEGVDLVPLLESETVPIRRKVGIVFQEGALFDSLSVYENVAYRLREEGDPEDEIEARVREVLRFVEMEEAIEKMPSDLSGGMRRRVSIARAIASEPCIMLYDSPTAGLDPVTANTINVLIMKLRDVNKVSSIVVTHRLQDTYFLSSFEYVPETASVAPLKTNGRSGGRPLTRFVVLREGRVYFGGTQLEFVNSSDPYLHKFLI